MIESANSPSPQAFGFNALSDAFIKDPLPFMTKGLSEHPIVKHDVTLDPVYSIFRYEDVKRVLLDWETFSSEPINTDLDALNLGRATENFILMNPPRHTRLRGLAQQGFFPKVIKKFLPRAEQIAKERFEYALKVDEFDLVNDVSSQLTIGMITGILGLPADDWSIVRDWTNTMQRNTMASFWLTEWDDERADSVVRVTQEMADYFHDHLKFLRKNPQDDNILSTLMTTELDGERFSDEEIESTAMLLLLAGNETTTNLITNFIRCMVRYPSQFELLKKDPNLIDAAIEETLRLEPSLRMTIRSVCKDAEFHGVTIPAGNSVALWFLAANRDPSVFEKPNNFDITTKRPRHLSFAGGPHFCLGAPLARMEARVAANTLLQRVNQIELLGDPQMSDNGNLNNILSLKARFHGL
jgi:cytochrome P450